MGKIETFEDLIAWQKAKRLVLSVYEITNSGAFAKDLGLRDQCRRASVSVVSNIAEGFERKGNKEFLQFLYIALGSLGELKTQIIISGELGYINKEQLRVVDAEIIEIRKIINGLINYMKASEKKGSKFSKLTVN